MSVLRKYGAATVIAFELRELDGVDLRTDASHVAGDIQISKDESAFTNTTNGFTLVGGIYTIALTATEMEASRITLKIVDQDVTKVWQDKILTIETYGNASAEHLFDLDGTPAVNLTQINGSTTPVTALEDQYDGVTGLTGDLYPATQAQLGSLSTGSAAISTTAASYVLTTGTQTGGAYTDTSTVDSVYHSHDDSGGSLDLYYEFSVGGSSIGVETLIDGYLNGNNDLVNIYAYNWTAAGWDQIGELIGKTGTTDDVISLSLLSRHTGSGADIGKIRIRFSGTGLSAASLNIDRIVASYTVVSQSVGYAQGRVWIDTNNGVAGTESFVNGVADNKVDSLSNAQVIATNVGLTAFSIDPASSITLSSSTTNKAFYGELWNLALGGQDIADSHFSGANVSGIGTGIGDIEFMHCEVGNVTIHPCHMEKCSFKGTFTFGAAGDYMFADCYSHVAGSGSPIFDLGAAIGATTISFRRWSGGIRLNNVQTGDVISVDAVSGGTVTIDGTGGTVHVRGMVGLNDLSNGLVTIVDDNRFDQGTITAAVGIIREGYAQGSGTGNNQIQLDAGASATTGAYDPAIVSIIEGTGVGQTRLILEYNGATKTAIVDRNWKVLPDSTSKFNIVGDAGRNHVNEGLATGGTGTSITLNANASSADDTYIGQIIFIRSGTGEDQSRMVTDYNGTTKVATVDRAWSTTPDTTSGYVMIPASPVLLAATTHTGAVIPTVSTLTGHVPQTADHTAAIAAAQDDLDILTGTGGANISTEGLSSILAAGDVDGYSIEETMKLMLSALVGIVSGAATTTMTFKAADGSKTRLVATVDADGNRSAVVKDAAD